MKNHQRIIIVLGVRRSGTSAVTKGLEAMGVSIVDQAHSPFNSFNEKGYWEDLEIHDFNMRLIGALEPLENRWRSILPLSEKEVDFLCKKGFLKQGADLLLSKLSVLSQPLGLKDPRFSILLPFWKRVFKTYNLAVSFVISLRHPLSTIGSMKAFGTACEPINTHDAKFLWAWISFFAGCLESTAGEERIVVDYNELLKQPAVQIKRIATAFNLEVQEDLLKKYSADFIDLALCHFGKHETPKNILTHDQELALEIYKQLLLVARDQISCDQPQPFFEQWKAAVAAVEPLLMMTEKNEQTILLLQAAVLVYRNKINETRSFPKNLR
ncbi:MAG: hypothetical protein K2W97_08075 [Chthoniobacterales bacterium]|nr:hypothetical protein [Chthoniobacterales bacterium]